MRSGLIAKKIGMTRVFNALGEVVPVTVLQYDSCVVTDVKKPEKHGYAAVQLSTGAVKTKRLTAADRGRFSANSLLPRAISREFRLEDSEGYVVGQEIAISHIVAGQKVDIVGTSIGKGFAGPMKRHNFRGLRASHGVSIAHRSHGSTGMCQDPGRVLKGKKMAGQMGNTRVTKQNLEVHGVDIANSLIMVIGSVPGPKNQYVTICDAVKGPGVSDLPYPAAFLNEKSLDNVPLNQAQEPTRDVVSNPVVSEDKSE
ncbi:MAG: 50S ribosomal protein L3 [Alphaproteobacteria bacterium]|nr:MAG: 50S ribosomal protein L3 [Alphaproteobacteria bacterium]